MEKLAVNPWKWQDAFGFVQANKIKGAGQIVMCSGQLSIDHEGRVLHPGDMSAQVRQAMGNLGTVLHESGFDLSDVVRLNYYTTDMDAFIAAGETLGGCLAEGRCTPTSTLLGVARLAIPGALIEIEATVVA